MEEETESSESTQTSNVAETSPEPNIIALASAAAERLEAANKITADLLTRQEAIQVQNTLGGTASAGAPSITAEEKAAKNAKDYLKGTGYEDML